MLTRRNTHLSFLPDYKLETEFSEQLLISGLFQKAIPEWNAQEPLHLLQLPFSLHCIGTYFRLLLQDVTQRPWSSEPPADLVKGYTPFWTRVFVAWFLYGSEGTGIRWCNVYWHLRAMPFSFHIYTYFEYEILPLFCSIGIYMLSHIIKVYLYK